MVLVAMKDTTKKPNVDPEICQEPRQTLLYVVSNLGFTVFSH
jgi:hypothetical protein